MRLRTKIIFTIGIAIFWNAVWAYAGSMQDPRLNIKEEDGSPTTWPYQLKVTNGTLTDNGDGTVSLTTGGGGGSGDIEAVGDCSTGSCFTGTSGTTLTFNAATDGNLFYNGEFSFDQNLGIGITNPTQALDVVGTVNATALTEGGNAVYNATETPGGELGGTFASFTIDDNVDVTGWTLGTSSATSFGIGTTNPLNRLDVLGNVSIGSGYSGIGTTAPINGMIIQGSVGIGTTNPGSTLEVVGDIELSGDVTDGTNATSAAEIKTAYDHSQDNTQAHSDYLLNSGSDSMAGTLTCDGVTMDANEALTVGGQVLTHDGSNFTFDDTVIITGNLGFNGTDNIYGNNAMDIYTTGANDHIVIDPNSGGTANLDLGVDGDTDLIRMWGYVGIGTTNPTIALEVVGTVNATTLTEGGTAVYNSGESCGGELGGTWASPTIDDSLAVTSWNLTTPTITTSLTTDSKTISEAEIGRLDGLAGIIATDATACTDLEGTGLSIAAGVLNWAAASTDLSDTADLLYEAELDAFSELQAQISDKTLINEEDAITLDNTLTITGNLVISDSGNIGSATDTDAITILSDGKVGIGITNPGNQLEVIGAVEASTSFIIGSADMSETDLEKLDGITNGTGAANKALVLDASLDVDLGTGDLACTDLDASGATTLAGTTFSGDIQLGETDIKLDATLSGDATWSGIVITGTSGYTTLAVGDLIYLNNDDSRWELADANLSDGYDKQLGIALTAAADGAALEILVYGKIRAATLPAFTVGSPVYMSETAGDVTQTAPTTTDSATRIIGFAITAEDLFFNPSNDYYTHT